MVYGPVGVNDKPAKIALFFIKPAAQAAGLYTLSTLFSAHNLTQGHRCELAYL